MRNFLIFILFIGPLFLGCKKTDQKLTSLIYGQWYHKYFNPTGEKARRFIFKTDFSQYYEDNNYGQLTLVADSLSFYIKDDSLHVFRHNGTPYYSYLIHKLNHNKLTLSWGATAVIRYHREF